MKNKQLFTAKEMQAILKLKNVQTVYRLEKRGLLKSLRVGRNVRFYMPEGVDK